MRCFRGVCTSFQLSEKCRGWRALRRCFEQHETKHSSHQLKSGRNNNHTPQLLPLKFHVDRNRGKSRVLGPRVQMVCPRLNMQLRSRRVLSSLFSTSSFNRSCSFLSIHSLLLFIPLSFVDQFPFTLAFIHETGCGVQLSSHRDP
jgi:hypothetical protein